MPSESLDSCKCSRFSLGFIIKRVHREGMIASYCIRSPLRLNLVTGLPGMKLSGRLTLLKPSPRWQSLLPTFVLPATRRSLRHAITEALTTLLIRQCSHLFRQPSCCQKCFLPYLRTEPVLSG